MIHFLPSSSNLLLLTGTLVFLTLFSAFLSATEIAFFSLSSSKIRSWKEACNPRKRAVYQILIQSRQLLVLIFMLNTIANVLLQNISSEIFGNMYLGFIGKILLPLAIILFFGELFPKWLGMVYNEKIAILGSSIYPLLIKIHRPLQEWLTNISDFFSRFFFFFLKPEPPLTVRELEEIVEHAAENRVLQEHEALLISNWIDLDRKTAQELMIPRSHIQVALDSSLIDLQTAFLKKSSHFNGIIIGKSDDLPIGFLQFNDLFIANKIEFHTLIETAKKRLFYVPDTMQSRQLLYQFECRKESIACVVDEHDMVLGYIHFKDIEQRLVRSNGLQKQPDSSTSIQIISDFSIIVDGSTTLEIVNQFLHIQLESIYRSSTINGWLIEQFDAIPVTGTSLVQNGVIFRVLSSNHKKIEKIFIQVQQKTAEHKIAKRKRKKEQKSSI